MKQKLEKLKQKMSNANSYYAKRAARLRRKVRVIFIQYAAYKDNLVSNCMFAANYFS